MFFRDPPHLGYHFGVILGGFLVDFGRFLVPFGEASERYFGNVFLCLLLPCRGPFTTFWQGISSLMFLWLPCVLLPCWCALVFSVVPCFPFPRLRAQRASERSERSARTPLPRAFHNISGGNFKSCVPLVPLCSCVFLVFSNVEASAASERAKRASERSVFVITLFFVQQTQNIKQQTTANDKHQHHIARFSLLLYATNNRKRQTTTDNDTLSL